MVYKRILAFLRKHPRILGVAQTARFLLMRGPARGLMIRYYRSKPPRAPLSSGSESRFPDLAVSDVVADLRSLGYAAVPPVPQDLLNGVIALRDAAHSRNILHPHRSSEAVLKIARDPALVAVCREYLGVEPVLYASRLDDTPPRIAAGESSTEYSRSVHFDVSDYLDLNLFVYLSDVDEDASPHVVVEDTHHRKTLSELLHPKLSINEARRRFGPRMRAITGAAGYAFFEDPNAYHMMSPGKTARWMLVISYTLQRSSDLAK